MKLVTFDGEAGRRIGVVSLDGGHVIDLDKAYAFLHGTSYAGFADMLALMHAGERGLDHARRMLEHPVDEAIHPASAVRLQAPVPVPTQLRDFSVFEKHLLQCGEAISRLGLSGNGGGPKAGPLPRVWYEQPLYYKGNRFSVIGTDTDVQWPAYSRLIDYELEFGVFIGTAGRDIPRSGASRHVFGYCIYNDFSARDAQFLEMPGLLGPAKGKDFDTGNAMGPWIVTPDELTDPYSLTMVVRVNGEEQGRGYSGEMQHRFDAMIAHVSASETLHVGEFLGSGTVGNGCGLEFGRFLQEDDVVELEVQGLGVLRNRVTRRTC
ncbi:fumarylacetoacetate hydrolase family protein [Paraburkholderia sp. BR10937]|uniref:fumarylacetoacetate hydrolase family protein n=1 Tax=Paraburkholderia sp. BR10937 TaxID=3236994 RepID=UPI0034D338B6